MNMMSNTVNRIRIAAGGWSSMASLLLFVGIAIVATFVTSAHSVARQASILDPSTIVSPGVLLFIGLAWLSRVAGRLRAQEGEMFYIESDPETMFTHTTVAGKSSQRKPSTLVPTPHHPDWDMADSIFKEFGNCKWIAESTACTHQEALSGGQYTFEREFDLPEDLSDVASAELLAMVDNWVTPTVNGNQMARKGGKIDKFEWDLKEFLKPGANVISFEVENNHAVAYLSDDPRWAEWNPYGLKYLIRIKHKA